jgi:hypothetical protein
MLIVNFIILGCLLAALAVATKSFYANRALIKQNMLIGHQLDELYTNLKNTKNLSEKNAVFETEEDGTFTSPAVLGSMLTVLVKKYGPCRLSLEDFTAVGDEYVSIYIDMTTNELILSLNSSLSEEYSLDLFKFTSSDDSTYH